MARTAVKKSKSLRFPSAPSKQKDLIAAYSYLLEQPSDNIGTDMLYNRPLLEWTSDDVRLRAVLLDNIVVTLDYKESDGTTPVWIAAVTLMEHNAQASSTIVQASIWLSKTDGKLAKILAEGLARTWVQRMNGLI